MSKLFTFPTLFDSVPQLIISKLKGWGYLKPNQKTSTSLSWSRNGNQTASISIMVDMTVPQPYIVLNYNYKDQPRNYKVYLVSMSSNLGKGDILYFLCPTTNKHCRKLYLIDGYFLHREAFNGAMYRCQTESKKYRQLIKSIGAYFETENLYTEIRKKHLKKQYAGKPTKKYLRLMGAIEKGESIPYQEIERLMYSR